MTCKFPGKKDTGIHDKVSPETHILISRHPGRLARKVILGQGSAKKKKGEGFPRSDVTDPKGGTRGATRTCESSCGDGLSSPGLLPSWVLPPAGENKETEGEFGCFSTLLLFKIIYSFVPASCFV